jgi:hypothetical protein
VPGLILLETAPSGLINLSWIDSINVIYFLVVRGIGL